MHLLAAWVYIPVVYHTRRRVHITPRMELEGNDGHRKKEVTQISLLPSRNSLTHKYHQCYRITSAQHLLNQIHNVSPASWRPPWEQHLLGNILIVVVGAVVEEVRLEWCLGRWRWRWRENTSWQTWSPTGKMTCVNLHTLYVFTHSTLRRLLLTFTCQVYFHMRIHLCFRCTTLYNSVPLCTTLYHLYHSVPLCTTLYDSVQLCITL